MSTFINTGNENSDMINLQWDQIINRTKNQQEYEKGILKKSETKSKEEIRPKYAIWFLIDSMKYMKYYIADFEKKKGRAHAFLLREKTQLNDSIIEFDDILKKLCYFDFRDESWESHISLAEIAIFDLSFNIAIYHLLKALSLKIDYATILQICFTMIQKALYFKLPKNQRKLKEKNGIFQSSIHFILDVKSKLEKINLISKDHALIKPELYLDTEYIENFDEELSFVYLNLKEIQSKNLFPLDTLWMLFELSLHFSDSIDGFETNETPEEYAMEIRKFDIYYGTLAWIIIFKESKPEKVKPMILSLIKQYPKNLEAQIYIITICLQSKQFQEALIHAERIYVSDLKFPTKRFLVVLSVIYSKCILKAGYLPAACRLLILTYLNNYDHPQILNLLGKILGKSNNKSLVTCGIGVIQECKRVLGSSSALIEMESNLMKKRGFLLESVILKSDGKLKHCFKDPRLKNDALLSALQWKIIYENSVGEGKEEERLICYEKLNTLVNDNPDRINLLKIFWKINKKENKLDECLKISEKMVNSCLNFVLPGNFWLEGFLCHSKSLFAIGKYDEAIYILKQLLSINLDLVKERNIDESFLDFDKMIQEHLVLCNGIFPKLKIKALELNADKFWKPKFEVEQNIYKNDFDEISSFPQYNLDFVISSDPKPLYLLGKFCQASPKYYKNGLKAIDLYIKLMNCKTEELLSQHFRVAIAKSKVHKIKLLYKNRDFSLIKVELKNVAFDLVELCLKKQIKECKNIWEEMKKIDLNEWKKD